MLGWGVVGVRCSVMGVGGCGIVTALFCKDYDLLSVGESYSQKDIGFLIFWLYILDHFVGSTPGPDYKDKALLDKYLLNFL